MNKSYCDLSQECDCRICQEIGGGGTVGRKKEDENEKKLV